MKESIIFLCSYHHMNTQKIANAIAAKINAQIIDINSNKNLIELEAYNLIGFGAGIDGGKHYHQMLEYVEKIPNVQNKKAFIFSTAAIYNEKIMFNNHKTLKNLLDKKGFLIADEFGCHGFTTRSIFNLIGGKNKNRPNENDIKNAEAFAEKLLKSNQGVDKEGKF